MQVAADTFIYTPLNVGLFFAYITAVEGGGWTVSEHARLPRIAFALVLSQMTRSNTHCQAFHFAQEVRHKLQQDFLPTMAAEVAIWPAYQAVNFARVPVQHQLLMCSIGTLFDSTFLCW